MWRNVTLQLAFSVTYCPVVKLCLLTFPSPPFRESLILLYGPHGLSVFSIGVPSPATEWLMGNEVNLATAELMVGPSSEWLLLSFSPFPVGNPVAEPGTIIARVSVIPLM